MINGKYSRRNNGSLNSVHTYIVVKDNVVKKQWMDVPNGSWSGNQPSDMIGREINRDHLKLNGYHPE